MRGFLAVAALLAAAGAGVGGGSGARAATYLDEVAWHNAVVDLDAALRPQGLTLRYVPISARFVSGEDGYGTYTDFGVPVFHATGTNSPIPSVWGTRTYSAGAHTWPGGFQTRLGCHSNAYPCLGAWAMTFGFDQPIYGFGGALAYRTGLQNVVEGSGIAPFSAVDQAILDGTLPSREAGSTYDLFFGVLQPMAMTDLRLTFWEGMGTDDTAEARISGLMLVAVPVPEPPPLPLVVAALAALGLAGTWRALSPAAGSR